MAENTVLVLTDKDIKAGGLLTAEACIKACEDAFWEFGHGIAQIIPRHRINTPLGEGVWHMLNVIPGTVPRYNVAALRLDSARRRFHEVYGRYRMDFPWPFSGLVFLFDLKTGELLCIYHDHYVSPIRVAATSAIGVKYMARRSSAVVGVLGSGFQAAAKLEAICTVRKIELAKVYSLNEDNRRKFAERMTTQLGIEVRAAESARAAVEDSDIVAAVTNSHEPVLNGEWLKQGCHVISTIGADRFDRRREIDEETVRRSAIVVVNDKRQIEIDQQPELQIPLRKGYLRLKDIYELGDIVAGKIQGRLRASDITHHNNNVGMGIQFAAAGAVLYANAREKGLGTELPLGLFIVPREGGDLSAP